MSAIVFFAVWHARLRSIERRWRPLRCGVRAAAHRVRPQDQEQQRNPSMESLSRGSSCASLKNLRHRANRVPIA